MDINQWRYAGRRMTFFGIPVMSFLVFFLWFPFPSWNTFLFCSGVVFFYFVLSMMGFTVPVLYQVILRVIRGKKLTGRPWWYRRSQR
ncbi:IcmT/TraK family protein [Erwinia amylovora]